MGEWDDQARDYVPTPGSRATLPEGLRFRAVWTSLDGLRSDGVVRTRFRPQGDATHTYVHLEGEGEKGFTVEVRPLLGRPVVSEGWAGPSF